MKTFPCPQCEKANVQKKPHVVMVKIGRYRISDGSGWAWVCPECKEVMHDGKEAERRERSAALVVLHDAEDISGVEMKDIRSIFGFRQTDLAKILDVSPETISRWESGHLSVSTMHRLAMGEVARGVIECGGPEAYMEGLRKRPLKLAPEDQAVSNASGGVASFFGTWPGDETDDELLAALKAID